MEETFRFNNLTGFKSFKHSNTGLNVNFANVAGPLYTMAVVVPVIVKVSKRSLEFLYLDLSR